MNADEQQDIDDLIDGEDFQPVRQVTLLSNERGKIVDKKSGVSLDLTDVHAGVTVEWLMSVFGMANRTVKKRLAGCPPMKKTRGAVIYNLRQAAAYLVDPKVNLEEFVKTLQPGDLPPKLSKDYWDAMLKQRKYQLLAGDLWATGDVLEVLGEVFKHIKESTQLWINTVERTTELTNKQRETLVVLADQLLSEVHDRLVKMPDRKRTASILEAQAIESTVGEENG